MQWMFDAGLKGGVNYDVLGAHGNTQAPVVDAVANPPSLPAFGDASFYFRRIEQLRDVQVKNGDADRQIWLLEFGWTADKIHRQLLLVLRHRGQEGGQHRPGIPVRQAALVAMDRRDDPVDAGRSDLDARPAKNTGGRSTIPMARLGRR